MYVYRGVLELSPHSLHVSLWICCCQGDVAETAVTFFHQSTGVVPSAKSSLTLSEVDRFLDKMATLTKEEDQTRELKGIVRRWGRGKRDEGH